MNNIHSNINKELSPQEKEVFKIIEEVINKYAPNTTARAVGGWVRDKLLGVPSDDIDIMIDNMSGEEFAKLVTKHMGLEDPHVIRQNPDASKHIETAKAYIPLSNGQTQEIDFAMARQEIYDNNSRIPEIKPATPQEDALRRDLTINSLFYNINQRKIEDFTGDGIKDLITNTIRTPLDPYKTFSDDPLRMFRTIRFAAKYEGQIDPETYAALQDPTLREKIAQKISKERIGTEFKKMLKNPNPDYAIELLKNSGLWQDIIDQALKGTKYEGEMDKLDMEQNNPWHKLSLWEHTFQTVKNLLNNTPDMADEQRIIMIMAALTHDLGKLYKSVQAESATHPGRTSYHGHEKESEEITTHILKYLRLEPLIDQVAGLARYHIRPHRMSEGDASSKTLRKFIRQMGELSLNWVDVLNLSIADALSKDVEIDSQVIQQYQDLESKLVSALQTMKPIEENKGIVPILNGNEIMQILEIKPGPWMKDIIEFVKEIMDENPEISKEDAAQKVRAEFAYLSQDNRITKNAGNEEIGSSYCPMHLFNKKREQLKKCYQEAKYYEVLSMLKDLKNDYENDEKLIRLTAYYLFYILLKNKEKFRNNELLEWVFMNAEKDFFDGVLACFTMGILINIDTKTEDSIILDLANKGKSLSPNLMPKILNSIKECHPFRNDLIKKISGDLDEND